MSFGREWKNEKRVVEDVAKRGFAWRFGAGLPAASDGQMLFLMTAISKMKEPRDGGSRIAIIHNGSPLFTGDDGSGPSEIRKYILESAITEITQVYGVFGKRKLAKFLIMRISDIQKLL